MVSSLRSGESCVTVFLSDSILSYTIFTPRCFVDVTPRTRKAQRELYKRRQQQIGNKDILFYFPLFLGFKNHSLGKRIIPEYN